MEEYYVMHIDQEHTRTFDQNSLKELLDAIKTSVYEYARIHGRLRILAYIKIECSTKVIE